MSTDYRLLLIGRADTRWSRALEQALSELGPLCVATEQEAIRAVVDHHYDVVIIDAGEVDDAGRLTSRLRTCRRETRVVVATLSRTWRRAKQVLQAGASDYIYKSTDERELLSRIEEVLSCAPPRWPH